MTKKVQAILISGLIFVTVVIVAVILMTRLPLTNLRENKDDDARKIALKKFGMDSVWVVSAGSSSSSLTTSEQAPHYPIYVLGEKNGEEVFIIVPQLKRYDAFQIDWPFVKSFQEIVAQLNEYAGNIVCQPDKYSDFMFFDNDGLIEMFSDIIGDMPLDIDFIMVYHEFIVFQSNQEIIVRKAN